MYGDWSHFTALNDDVFPCLFQEKMPVILSILLLSKHDYQRSTLLLQTLNRHIFRDVARSQSFDEFDSFDHFQCL